MSPSTPRRTRVKQAPAPTPPPRPHFLLRHRMALALEGKGWSVPQMAEKLGVSRVSVWSWLNGRSKPNMPALILWAQLTEVDPEWLMGPDPKAVRDQHLPDNPGYVEEVGECDSQTLTVIRTPTRVNLASLIPV